MKPILAELEALYNERETEIEAWLAAKRDEREPYLYNSVDLRHSGGRLVPVDTNLYPAGFNNLSQAAEARTGRYFAHYFAEHASLAKRVLIVPEAHTRNLAYLDNLQVLLRIIASTGMEARIGSLGTGTGEPLVRNGAILATQDGFVPDMIVLNNDCTSGIPELLQGLSQPIFPPPEMGWHVRRKSEHFHAYKLIASEFAAAFGLDPWRISAYFHRCGKIDFKERTGLDCLAKAVDSIIAQARNKHAQYGISDDPYVFIKADSGTYGMGIMTARDGAEMLEINKKERNKMQVVKEGARVSEVIIQEGIPTIDVVEGKTAEPMVYLADGIPAGGMFRVNGSRDSVSNLNASGVEFTGMCDEAEAVVDCRKPIAACHFRSYGIIATLAALAVPRENYTKIKDEECNGDSGNHKKQA